MQNLLLLVLSVLLCCYCSAQEETQTLFLGEDLHIPIPVDRAGVSFKSSVGQGSEKVLMAAGKAVDPRAKLNDALSHLILENVGETDEGVYTITSFQNTENVTRLTFYVRDCYNEVLVKYGSDFYVVLSDFSEPLQVGFRNSTVEANQTSVKPVELLNDKGKPTENYNGRINVTAQKFTLQAVTGADEGSYTFRAGGKEQKKICLKVKAHQVFVTLTYGGTLKINLHINSSLARLFYTPKSDKTGKYVILESGELKMPPNLNFENRLSLEESVCVLTGLKASDAGVFSETDLHGFHVSEVYLEVEEYRLPNLFIAIIALVALLVLLLLVCLISCLIKIRKRAAKAKATEENTDKAEGDAFRQVVKDACTNQNEEAPALSQKEDITEKSQSTEVSIKGLEVSTKEPSLQERNLETSDSGVGFNTSGLPVDSDTDVQTAPIDSDVLSSSAAPSLKADPEPKSAPSPPKPAPTSDLKPAPVAKSTAPPPPSPEPKVTPESKPAVTPEPKLTLSSTPETKATLTPSPEPKPAVTPEPKPAVTPEPKQAVTPDPKPEATKPIPSPTPEAPKTLTPTLDAKPPTTPDAKPAVSPALEPTPAKVSTPEQKPAVSPTPEDPKTSTITPAPDLDSTPEPKASSPALHSKPPVSPVLDPKPTTNGTPESKDDISPKLDVKTTEAPASTPPKSPDTGKSLLKTPEVISSGGLSPEGKLDLASPSDSAPPSSTDGAAPTEI
ncbi:uncharacterized protein [Paramisgurnus dabryanus]|uniref:uncharacterized protein isoform X2 n=1 Tax=Paramisgurnus dabryanus TaxID=90735 RepID=UPI0031F419AB